jgi:hypothetical protein
MDVSFSFSISMKTLLAWGKLVYAKKEKNREKITTTKEENNVNL